MESMKEMIEKRAYHLFLKRGGLHGYHMQDWVLAEKEIKAEVEAKKKSETKPAASAPKAEPPKEVKAASASIVKAYPAQSSAPAAARPAGHKPNSKGLKKGR
jgi:hypothetical protein